MGIKEEIQKQKELLYLNSLKVANQTLTEAESEGLEVSSGLLSSSASLLKLKLDDVFIDTDSAANDMQKLLSSFITESEDSEKQQHSSSSSSMDSESTTKIKSQHYRKA